MKLHNFPIAVAFLVVGAFALAGSSLPLAPTGALAAKNKAVHQRQATSAPHTVAKAKKLARQSVLQLVGSYSEGRAKSVCTDLTAKARKELGGNVGCVSKVRLARDLEPVSKIVIKKIVIHRNHVRASIVGYLNRDRKHRLVAPFEWEGGRYRLDLSLSALSRLFG